MSRNADAPPGPEVWRAQNLRLIAFPTQPQYGVAQNWWHDLTGANPENILDRPQKHEREESGTFDGHILALGIDLLRIQWAVIPRVDTDKIEIADQPTILGPFVDRQAWFRDLMDQWLQHCPPINRLAFTASLMQPVENQKAGHEMLDRYLRWVDIDPQSSEFLYRINRRANSAVVQGLDLNRLSTWVVAKFAVFDPTKDAGGQPQGRDSMWDEWIACAVELDINTAPEFQKELPRANLAAIFGELIDAGLHLATHGDARP